MRLIADRDTGKFLLGPGTTQLLAEIREKRSPAAEVEVQFLRGVTPQELPADASGKFNIKAAGEFDSQPLAAALAWTKTGTGIDTIYTFTVGLINDVLDALLGIEDPTLFTVVAATDLFTSAESPPIGALIQYESDDTLPAPLLPNQDYFVITAGHTVTDWKVSLASEGTPVDVTDTGTGNHFWTRAGNDIESVTLMAAMEWTADGRTNETQTVDFILENDVVRPGDVPPSTPALVYAVFLPEVTSLAQFKAIPTTGMILGYLVEILIDVSGTTTLYKYRLVSGPATEAEPEHVEPDDYDLGTNDRHWEGAAGPAGPPGQHAGLAYKWNTDVTTTDPTAGKAKVNNATLASATALYISETDDDGNSLAALLATFDDGTSTIRGRILLQDPAMPVNFVFFDITGTMLDNGAWDTFIVAHVSSGGTLTNNLPVRVFFFPKGDKGDIGANGGFKYQFNTGTSGDPGTGKFLFNHATFGSTTALLISETDGNANALATFLATLDDSTSANKTLVIAQKQSGEFFAFFITGALTDAGTYDSFPITPITTFGSIANNDILYLTFIRTGDKGDTGTTGATGREPALYYLWNTNTANSDPGAGKLKVNNGTLASATSLYINETDNDTNSLSALLATWDDGTSAVKGRLFIHSPTTPTIFAVYDITGTITDNGDWDAFTITHVASGGTFTNNMPVAVVFIPKGDLGTTTAYLATSVTSLAIGTGSKAFTVAAGLSYSPGARARAASAADTSKWMEGIVTAYSGTTLTINVDLINSSGTFADWNINIAGNPGAAGSGGGTDYILIQDQKTTNTDGGDFTSGAWRTRDLNTEVSDAGGHASVASNQITLAAGTYRCRISAPAYQVTRHQLRLQDITNTATLLMGSCGYTVAGGGNQTHSFIEGRFTLAGTTVLEVQHQAETTQASGVGFGVASHFGAFELYTSAAFERE